jgi:hypothetical protein
MGAGFGFAGVGTFTARADVAKAGLAQDANLEETPLGGTTVAAALCADIIQISETAM